MRFIAIVLLVGCVWAAIAVALLLAMRVGDVPAPSEAPLVLAVVLVALYLPSLVGLGLELCSGARRSGSWRSSRRRC